MNNAMIGYSDSGSLMPGNNGYQVLPLKTRLDLAVKEAQSRLDEAHEAQEILDRNPEFERLLNIMQKGRF
jgi:hypothetical protein